MSWLEDVRNGILKGLDTLGRIRLYKNDGEPLPDAQAAAICTAHHDDTNNPHEVTAVQAGAIPSGQNKQILCFGYNASISAVGTTTIVDAKTVDGATNTNGYRMLRAGKVTGVSIQYRCTGLSAAGHLRAYPQLNKVSQSMYAEGSVAAVSDNVGVFSIANPFTFSANSRINVELQLYENAADVTAVEDIAVVVEIET